MSDNLSHTTGGGSGPAVHGAKLRTIGLTRIVELIHCRKWGLNSLSVPPSQRDPRSLKMLAGEATHRLLGGRPEAEVADYIRGQLIFPTEALRQRLMREATTMARRAPESRLVDRDDEVQHNQARSEHQLFWLVGGYRLALKPDRWRFVDEQGNRWPCMPDGKYPPGFNPSKHTRILRVIDYKTKEQIDSSDWEREELMTCGVRECLGWTGLTQMVLYPLRQGLAEDLTELQPVRPVIRWWNPKLPDGTLSRELEDKTRERLRAILADLDASWEALAAYMEDPEGNPDDGFPPTPGGHCFGCALRHTCPLGQQFMELRRSEHTQAASLPIPHRNDADELERACFARGSKRVSLPASELFDHVGHMVMVRLGDDTRGRFRKLKSIHWVDGNQMVRLVFEGDACLTAGSRDRYDVSMPAPGFTPSQALATSGAVAEPQAPDSTAGGA